MRDMNLLQIIAAACAVISGLLTLLFGVLKSQNIQNLNKN